jgi:acyl-CoA synthetase (NDP forming)
VAVVGASERPGTPGRLVVEHLLRFGYPGRILPVNARDPGTILGLSAYPSVIAAGERPDLAVVLVPAEAVPGAVADCAAAGVRVCVVGSSGFAETGEEGRRRQANLAAAARASGMRLVGPNCIGSVGFGAAGGGAQVASFSPLFAGERTRLVPGGIGFASASGALGYGTVSLALERGLGLFAAVTTGNEADVSTLEALAALAAEPDCTALLGYVESLSDGPALRALAAAGKPTALLVAGTSAAGARAAASHTGALATADRLTDGALRQLGIVRARDVDDLLDLGAAFALPRPAGPRVAVVTTSGGSGILAADAIEAQGLTLAELAPGTTKELTEVVPAYGSVANPVDVTATVMRDRELVGRCLAAVVRDPGVDAVVLCFCVLVGADVDAIVGALAGLPGGKPVVVARTGAEHLAPAAAERLRELGVPVYQTPARAVRAVAARLAAADGAAAGSGAGGTAGRGAAERGAAGRGAAERGAAGRRPAGTLAEPPADRSEAGLKSWLSAHGVRTPRGWTVTHPADAPAAVERVGGRAVLKVVVPSAAHKSELGGVALGVTPVSAAAIAARLLRIPGAVGVLVEEQVAPGVEVLVGIGSSPLGPTLTLGAGGVLTELLDDVAVRLLPVDRAELAEAVRATRVGRLLAGYRGAAPADVDALLDLVERVAALGAPVELNPVVVNAGGAVVLDAALVEEG